MATIVIETTISNTTSSYSKQQTLQQTSLQYIFKQLLSASIFHQFQLGERPVASGCSAILDTNIYIYQFICRPIWKLWNIYTHCHCLMMHIFPDSSCLCWSSLPYVAYFSRFVMPLLIVYVAYFSRFVMPLLIVYLIGWQTCAFSASIF